jgi:hypothetical protein
MDEKQECWKNGKNRRQNRTRSTHENTKARKKRGGRETWPAFLEFVWKG